jgi:PTS system fructose-specific IIB component
MKIVAVTACPTGIAHTYMAADILVKEAHRRGISLKVETQGAMGIENALSVADIVNADVRVIASEIEIEEKERFKGSKVLRFSIEEVLTDVKAVMDKCLAN